ncbi:uncharacterized protein LOC105787763 [Gossypium raimondii]|uniref:Uncharacterized protein n=1 Tax=Gossypium raimondii TaxID=29730 RepID=A0A0D2QFC2_GOSRA|nr:uncharacterized protein LOC105787763 [Gossypium raimondii]KJB18199.1 hypothetical protein B456_003G038700 [Gossypium raimondii]MBA0581874.1 hypothetical protein [Gossypium raimondii]
MAPLLYFSFRKVLLLYLAFFMLISLLVCTSIVDSHELRTTRFGGGGRRLLELEEEDEQLVLKKKSSNFSNKKNQTKLVKPSNVSTKNQTKLVKSVNVSTKNQTKLVKSLDVSTKTSNLSAKNQTKVLKPTNSTKTAKPTVSSPIPKKLNSTSKVKKLNSTTPKASDLLKLSSPKNKPTTKTPVQSSKPEKKPTTTQIQKQQKKQPSWVDDDDESDLVSEFRDLPAKFQQTLIPDLEKISTTSKVYINKYNKEFTKQFKPYVGNKHAPTIATVISCAFLLIPLLLVSLIFNRIKAYFSLQKILIFIQVYLSIYFSILCLTSLVTGLEPLKFFYATSPSTYVCLQVLQTLGYVLYLLLLLMYLILVFSTESGLGSKMLGLGQIFVGFAVGLHYYVAVFHRVVLHQPPKTNWKVHGMYATFFLVICLFAGVDRRKKAYLEEGGEEGKKN